MDFTEELDYEEDDLSSTECNDQYLQIDISEEEENLVSGKTNQENSSENQTYSEVNKSNNINDNDNFSSSNDNNEQNSEMAKKSIEKGSNYCTEIRKSQKGVGGVKKREKHFCGNFQIAISKKVSHHACHDKKNSVGAQKTFSEFGVKRYLSESLPEDEKRIVDLKKEARLKRFNHYDSPKDRKEPSLQNSKIFRSSSPVRTENLVIDTVQDRPLQEKPYINKELLLKKKNPFAENSKMSSCAFEDKIKEENDRIKVIEDDNKFWVTSKSQENLLKRRAETRDCGGPIAQSFRPFEKDADSSVKFVRTVSKSFCELRSQSSPFEKYEEEAKSLFRNSLNTSAFSTCSVEESGKAQSELIGCIVKVLNIPPSTTIDDVLALCRPIGSISEIKLNYPKENSVVIRFAESTCAEMFFRVYHGQKMNNYFLNVIVV